MLSRTTLRAFRLSSANSYLKRYGAIGTNTRVLYSTSSSGDGEGQYQKQSKEEQKVNATSDLFADLVEEETSSGLDTSSPLEQSLLDLIERQEEIYKNKGTPGPKFLDKSPRKIPQTALWDVLSNRSGFRSRPRSILPKTIDEDQLESQIAQLQSAKNNLELRNKMEEFFGDPYMGYAIYQQMKRKGVVSYVTGCSARVYNELLINSWDILRDRTKVESFLTEMIKAGVEANPETKRIVSRIISEEAEYGKEVDSLKVLVQSLELPA
ncbi:hypothetical protein K493DRAFT_311680 [Basidiobolus meristosporus CBS 931.73]|uniref:Mtf2-like C-terminal domain-containing protein n=1 Tax=Basidiobolus meristosporus CBS 931.73 TaxID=1314790 RepID=A0A1Y1Z0R7_9FUNG|nr:hypothetical protein K493DRAFT_311680 [Basidiobolus meristosporus CBS 931.73]|eukprot:ORY03527.1 hypothetical protein K493DRAFT_311680 [Basidiobolus meristosporus CBS 931.73]